MSVMKIDLYIAPQLVDEMGLRDRTVVVIDVLRASTTLVTALRNGARQIIPATTVESAVKISGNLFGDVFLLGGERNGRSIEGFNLGNSPAEYSEERVGGKSVIFSSSNGTPAIMKGRFARELLLCAFVNVSAVVRALREKERDFTLLCAGHNGMLSLEDMVCAGMVLHLLTDGDPKRWELDDGCVAAQSLYRTFGKAIPKMLRQSEHGRFLEELGFGDDLRTCAAIDTVPVVPRMDGSFLKLKTEPERREQPPAPQG